MPCFCDADFGHSELMIPLCSSDRHGADARDIWVRIASPVEVPFAPHCKVKLDKSLRVHPPAPKEESLISR